MDKTSKAKQDFLAPPEWWRKWRPLRWLAGGAILAFLALMARQLIEGEVPPPEVALRQPPAPAPVEPLPPTAVEPMVIEVAQAVQEPALVPPPPPVPVPAPVAAPPAAPPKSASPTVASATPALAVPAQVAVIEALPPAKPVSDYEAFTRVESAKVELMAFRSYTSVDDTFGALQKAGYEPAINSNHRKVPEELPPYHLDRIDVKEYRHLGQTGSLTLQFFNDRLFEAEFEPDDAEPYVVAFRRQYPQLRRGKTGRTQWESGALRISSSLELAVSDVGQSLRTRPYALWQDRRLVGQRDGWDARYASELRR